MRHYVRISLETHLFFARIMKEHALFLQAGFVQKDGEWIRKAEHFRGAFEELLKDTVYMSNGIVGKHFLDSGEMVTKCTLEAEKKTSELTGLPINSRITTVQMKMECGKAYEFDEDDVRVIDRLNQRTLNLVKSFIEFKEHIIKKVECCQMFTANYPLLLDHVLREAKMYREIIEGLMQSKKGCGCMLENQEEFWNCIMMEHALFIRGLLDPCEGELISTADGFAHDFDELLEMDHEIDCHKNNTRTTECCDKHGCKEENLTAKTLEATCELRDFKSAATEGLVNCKIKSIILPLLADHVTREANHYIRILKHGYGWDKEK